MEAQYISAHEELIEEYLKDHPEATWEAAYEITADAAGEYCIELALELAAATKRHAHSWRRRGSHERLANGNDNPPTLVPSLAND